VKKAMVKGPLKCVLIDTKCILSICSRMLYHWATPLTYVYIRYGLGITKICPHRCRRCYSTKNCQRTRGFEQETSRTLVECPTTDIFSRIKLCKIYFSLYKNWPVNSVFSITAASDVFIYFITRW